MDRPIVNTFAQSTPFAYLIANDSLLSAAELEAHYARIAETYHHECAAHPQLDYLGAKLGTLYRRWPMEELRKVFDERRFDAAYLTAERAVDTEELGKALRHAVSISPRIKFMARHRVAAIAQRGDGHRIEGSHPEGSFSINARHVVNAMWENRIRFDQMIGIDVPQGWVHRLKFRVIAQLPDRLRGAPSATMVLGPYGDVVVRPNGTAYLSWYPKGLQGWTHDVTPPPSWNGPCRGEPEPEIAQSIARDILEGIDAWYPGIADAKPLLIDAGAIVAYGRSDIDNANSALHLRSQIGVYSLGNYHSIEPGKMTTAPLYAEEAAARILEQILGSERTQRIA